MNAFIVEYYIVKIHSKLLVKRKLIVCSKTSWVTQNTNAKTLFSRAFKTNQSQFQICSTLLKSTNTAITQLYIEKLLSIVIK